MYTVPGPVSGLTATLGIIELTVLWTPPSEPNGVIIMYEVCTNSSGVFSYTNTSATQHTLRDLSPNTVVTFSVRAYTIIGPGEYVTGQASTENICRCSFSCLNVFILCACLSSYLYNTIHLNVVVVNGHGHGWWLWPLWLWSTTVATVTDYVFMIVVAFCNWLIHVILQFFFY